jgi:hypothetical protein
VVAQATGSQVNEEPASRRRGTERDIKAAEEERQRASLIEKGEYTLPRCRLLLAQEEEEEEYFLESASLPLEAMFVCFYCL